MYIRRPAVAGSFYPSDPEKLKRAISSYLSEAEKDRVELKGRIYGIVSPHAGYIYSGPVAAYGFSHLKNSDMEGFVIIAPSHRGRFNGASVIPEGLFSTPLGDVSIDEEIGKSLVQSEYFGYIREIDEPEHSHEVQIPFLQSVKSPVKIVPVVIGTVDLNICRKVGEKIADVLISHNRRYGVIISTDLSHYYPYKKAVQMDGDFIASLKLFDEKKLEDTVKSGKGEACGEGAILAGIAACKRLGATRLEVVKYANSGDTAGSKDEVVGYVSAVILGEE